MDSPVGLLATIQDLAEERGVYRSDAYLFLLQALERKLDSIGKRRHISGAELLHGVKDLARERFGPLAKDVLNSWGVHSTLDFGHVVFHLVEAGVLKKTPDDSLADFIDQYDFRQVFEVEYFENPVP